MASAYKKQEELSKGSHAYEEQKCENPSVTLKEIAKELTCHRQADSQAPWETSKNWRATYEPAPG